MASAKLFDVEEAHSPYLTDIERGSPYHLSDRVAQTRFC